MTYLFKSSNIRLNKDQECDTLEIEATQEYINGNLTYAAQTAFCAALFVTLSQYSLLFGLSFFGPNA